MHIEYRNRWSNDVQKRSIVGGTKEQHEQEMIRLKWYEDAVNVRLVEDSDEQLIEG